MVPRPPCILGGGDEEETWGGVDSEVSLRRPWGRNERQARLPRGMEGPEPKLACPRPGAVPTDVLDGACPRRPVSASLSQG